jgi:hypothetical protein
LCEATAVFLLTAARAGFARAAGPPGEGTASAVSGFSAGCWTAGSWGVWDWPCCGGELLQAANNVIIPRYAQKMARRIHLSFSMHCTHHISMHPGDTSFKGIKKRIFGEAGQLFLWVPNPLPGLKESLRPFVGRSNIPACSWRRQTDLLICVEGFEIDLPERHCFLRPRVS